MPEVILSIFNNPLILSSIPAFTDLFRKWRGDVTRNQFISGKKKAKDNKDHPVWKPKKQPDGKQKG